MPRLFLIDSFGFIFRAYHARARSGAPPMRTTSGISTEAVYIFHNMMRKLLNDYKPEYLAAVFESVGKTFRDDAYAEYKANRTETPPDLLDQIPWIKKLLEAQQVPILEFANYEADDVIGTLAKRFEAEGLDVVIVSSDKDMLQLVTEHTTMFNPMKDDKWFDIAETEAFMGVKPSQVADLLALKGDSVDNIPGAPGIGDKGAKDIIQRFGSVENALEHAAEVERKMYRESLQNHRDQILLSKQLATIHTTVPVEAKLEDLTVREPDRALLKEVYQGLEFFSFLKEMGPLDDGVVREYQRFESAKDLDAWLGAIPDEAPVAVAIATPSEGMFDTPLIGLSAKAGSGKSLEPPLPPAAWARLRITHDAKAVMQALDAVGVEARNLEHDVMLYAFLLTADPATADLANLTGRFLDRSLGGDPAEHAEAMLALFDKLGPEVDAQGLRELYENIDLPLAPVLAGMEQVGIRVDPGALGSMSQVMDAELQRLSSSIYELAGKVFNINSPQQLGKVLFEDLSIPFPGRAPKGKISTAADVLDLLSAEHEIVKQVLEYRQVSKLKGTYVDALPALIRPSTGRVHTTFNQVGAATGRLSSNNPNVQNIPIRTDMGREIRRAFVPREGWKLIVADYSQIELRLLAHMSRDAVLTEAFRNGEDIHTRTAAEVMGVPPLMVTAEMRRGAKAVNFGIVYGQTAFGLATSLSIDRKEAERYISSYFARYAGVRKFIDATIAEVRKTGYAVTLHGRKRPIPDMHSKNPSARGFAERTAVNTPLQGTAADLIKMAMIRIDKLLRGRETKLLLQVHDELIFEAPPSEVEEMRKLVKQEMEQVYRLEVPLVVDVGVGDNWRDAK